MSEINVKTISQVSNNDYNEYQEFIDSLGRYNPTRIMFSSPFGFEEVDRNIIIKCIS